MLRHICVSFKDKGFYICVSEEVFIERKIEKNINHFFLYFKISRDNSRVSYAFLRRRVPVREDTYPVPSAYQVGWPVPLLASFISLVLPPVTYSLLVEQ